ncbi:Ribosomal RNA small subunit methyltransferase G [Turneriella parva DSM 21527]|uniref:Ribosomal RNA small subunit methyltransferase G n=1 Tax=Turneriella parva (strain ATCC BAA-1111 / DSM 21527 / NCTC 11395 / H) TaxID=869212 RepID=I4B8F8_TURPD|nr:Ribosomal RNA small subunit methyltransferase G [Turneriella parva DSM 21527]
MQKPDTQPRVFSTAEILRLLREIPGITEQKAGQLRRHWQMLVESDDKTDLTRLESTHEIAIKHYLDCAMPLKFTSLPSPLLDIGSGAGFPGLVLKILSPETEVILGEVRPKRTRFLQQVIDELGLTGVQVFAHRIGPQFPLEIQGVATRALESCRDTLYRVAPFLPAGGRVLLLKGPKGDEEIAEALAEMKDFAHEKTYSYNLADTRNERRLVIMRRERESVRKTGESNTGAPKSTGRVTEITSRANEQFKSLLSLTEAKGIRKEKLFLVSGEKLVQEILTTDRLRAQLQTLLVSSEMPRAETGANTLVLSPALFREVDVSGTRSAIGVMQLPGISAWQPTAETSGVTVFLPFQDPANIGAAIRSAAAFGARRVVLTEEAASPFLPKSVRAAANALFHVELMRGPRLSEVVKSVPGIFRLDMQGEPLHSVRFAAAVNLLAGVEGYGFTDRGGSIPITIPMQTGVESLNAQTALSIALYEIQRRQLAEK